MPIKRTVSAFSNAEVDVYVTLLGQLRPADTNPASIYSPVPGRIGVIRHLVVCNTSGVAATYRVFLDDDGTTYNESTAIFWDNAIGANATVLTIAQGWAMRNDAGNLAVRSSAANALTFTVFGVEFR